MPEYRVFERADGRKVAINPELVEAIAEAAGAAGGVLIKMSSGDVKVKISLEEAIERLHHHHDIPKKPTRIR